MTFTMVMNTIKYKLISVFYSVIFINVRDVNQKKVGSVLFAITLQKYLVFSYEKPIHANIVNIFTTDGA